MTEITRAITDIEGEERIQPIHVETEYVSRYQSINRIRDIPEFYIDEPRDLGGRNTGPTALEMTLAALNSCSAMIMFVLRNEFSFRFSDLRFETDGWIDVRRIEMKRSGLKYSQVEPIAFHYHRVSQKVFLTTAEPPERIAFFRDETKRLCPLQRLLTDAGVQLEAEWVAVPPQATAGQD